VLLCLKKEILKKKIRYDNKLLEDLGFHPDAGRD